MGTVIAVITNTDRRSGIANGSQDSRVETTKTVGKTAVQMTNAVLYLGALLVRLSADSESQASSPANIVIPDVPSRASASGVLVCRKHQSTRCPFP